MFVTIKDIETIFTRCHMHVADGYIDQIMSWNTFFKKIWKWGLGVVSHDY